MDERFYLPLFLLGCLVAYHAVVWLARLLYFRHHKTSQDVRCANRWTAILAATSMFLFVTLTMHVGVGLISLVPLTLATYLGLKRIIVCDTCRRTIHTHAPFTVRWHHSRCAERNANRFH
jgi:hypothetical protein